MFAFRARRQLTKSKGLVVLWVSVLERKGNILFLAFVLMKQAQTFSSLLTLVGLGFQMKTADDSQPGSVCHIIHLEK